MLLLLSYRLCLLYCIIRCPHKLVIYHKIHGVSCLKSVKVGFICIHHLMVALVFLLHFHSVYFSNCKMHNFSMCILIFMLCLSKNEVNLSWLQRWKWYFLCTLLCAFILKYCYCYLQVSSPTIIVERAGSCAWAHKSWRVREEFTRTVTSAINLFASTELPLQRAILPPVLTFRISNTFLLVVKYFEDVILTPSNTRSIVRYCCCWMIQILLLGTQLFCVLR